MRVYSKSALKEFWGRHADAEKPLRTWYSVVKGAQWSSPADIKQHYPDASILRNNRVVFNIKGNDYRLIAAVHYDARRVFVRFIGTHAEYDGINAEMV
jgi:mRNA interferase HigB